MKYGLEFDGVDDYVDLGLQLPGNGIFSIEFSFLDLSLSEGVRRWFTTTREMFTSSTVVIREQNGGIYLSVGGTSHLLAREWKGVIRHYAIVSDNSRIKLYEDGILIINISGSPGTIEAAAYFGGGYESGGTLLEYAKGVFDEVRIWDIARTQAEIQSNMSTSLVGSEPGLIAYYPIVTGSGSVLYDQAGNNDGTIYGATWKQYLVISGTVTGSNGEPAERIVRVYDRGTGEFIGSAVSDPTTGMYTIESNSATAEEINRIVFADDEAEGVVFNDIIDRIIPE